ncbi:MAG: IS110 family transposase, partial [Fervidobacterium sp.]
MPKFKYFLGIDVSLNTLDICILNAEEKIVSQKRFSQTKEEFDKILNYLQSIGNPTEMLLGLESTGSYHINILNLLSTKGYHTTLLNPLLIKNSIKGDTLRKTKTDKISAKAIATYLLKHLKDIKIYTPTETTNLLGRECETLTREIAKLKNRIKQITFNIFNELPRNHNILTKTMLEFLLEVPSARIARKLGQEKITEIIKQSSKGKGRKITISAEEIIKIANNTISIDD